MTDAPIIEFFRLYPNARPPKRAERSAGGTLPARAMRYCDAATTASSYGYWVFPPITVRMLWDGDQVFWAAEDDDEWMPLTSAPSGSIQLPDFASAFDEMVPKALRGLAPPFLTALIEPGAVQIWSGLLVKTRSGWSTNVRSPVNVQVMPNIVAWEGVIETDVWFGPLFSNFRITKTDTPVILRAGVPFMQVQPIPQMVYSENVLGDWRCSGADDVSEADWTRLARVLEPSPDPESRKGDYAVAVRKRRLCPVDVSGLLPQREGG